MAVTLRKPAGEAGSAFPAIVVGLFAAFGGILFGYVYPKASLILITNGHADTILEPLAALLP